MKLLGKLGCSHVLCYTLQHKLAVMGWGVEGVSGPLHLTHVRPHLDAVFYLGPTVQDSLQQTGVSPVETTKMVQGP